MPPGDSNLRIPQTKSYILRIQNVYDFNGVIEPLQSRDDPTSLPKCFPHVQLFNLANRNDSYKIKLLARVYKQVIVQ